MATYKMSEIKFNEVAFPAVPYKLHLRIKGLKVTENDVRAIEKSFRWHRKKYPKCSFLMCYSKVKGSNPLPMKIKVKTGDRGRPKTKVIGKAVKPHIHMMVIGDETCSANSYAEDMVKSINKRFGRAVTKKEGFNNYEGFSRDNTAAAFIAYSLGQCEHPKMGGDFDFRQFEGFEHYSVGK